MNAKQMSFKAMIKRIADEEQIPAQVVLQNFMFERFFARVSKTKIRENLIVKGGTLISQYLGLSKRVDPSVEDVLYEWVSLEWVSDGVGEFRVVGYSRS